MRSLRTKIIKATKNAVVRIDFRIPIELANIIESDELSPDQKINLVKSYTDDITGEDGKPLPRISNQYAVILIMVQELENEDISQKTKAGKTD